MVYENMAIEHVEHNNHICRISRQPQEEEEHPEYRLIVRFFFISSCYNLIKTTTGLS
jgi:hypothetical protein